MINWRWRSVFVIWLATAASSCESTPPCVGDCATAVIAVGSDADVLFPPLSQGNVGQAVSEQLFLKLADIGLGMNTVGDSGFVPKLAESWEFEDSLTIVFRLHEGARWHDGPPVTAEDVVFSFDLYRDTLVNASARPLLGSIASVTARSDLTVEVRFNRRYSEQFYDATHHVRILPKHLLDSIPRDRLGSHEFLRRPVGNGPYRFVAWRAGETIELGADSSFFLGTPQIARLIWRISPDFTTALTQLVAGEADIVEALLGPEDIERVRAADDLRLVDYASAIYVYLGFNLRDGTSAGGPHPLFADRELRRAVTLGVDRQAIKQAVLGDAGKVIGGPTTPMMRIWREDRRQLPFDSARARRMLADQGWTDGNQDGVLERNGRELKFDLLYPGSSRVREQAAVIIQAQLGSLGIDVRLVSVEFNVWLARMDEGRFDASLGAWLVDAPPSGMRQFWTSDGIGVSNHGWYQSAVFDSLFRLAVAADDPVEAAEIWDNAISVINEDAPAIWLFSPTMVAGVNRRFGNVTIRPDLWAATLWRWTVN